MTDDDGTGTTGTIFNNAWKTSVYDQIDGIMSGGSFITGGYIDAAFSVRATGSVTPTTGTGVELVVVAGVGSVQAYNRTGAVYVQLNVDGNPTYINGTSAGNVGFGMTSAPGAFVEIRKTTAQLRLSYDGSNRLTATVASTGTTTLALAGTTPNFIFSQWVDVAATVRATSSTGPTTGAGIEVLFVGGTTGAVQAYNRTGAAYLAMTLDGLPITLNSAAAAGVVIGSPTGGNKGTNTLNCTTYYGNGTVGVSAGSFSTITAITTVGGIVTQLTGSSDARLKDVVGPYLPGLAAIRQLQPVRYHWNARAATGASHDPAPEHVGVLAQNLEEAIPEAVGEETWADGSTWKTIDERRVLMALINAVQALDARLSGMETRYE